MGVTWRVVVGALFVAISLGSARVAADAPVAAPRVPTLRMIWSSSRGGGQEEVSVSPRPGPQLFDSHLRDWQCGVQWNRQSGGPGMMVVICSLRQGPPGTSVTLTHQCTDGTQGFEAPSILTVHDSDASGDTAATLIARCDGA